MLEHKSGAAGAADVSAGSAGEGGGASKKRKRGGGGKSGGGGGGTSHPKKKKTALSGKPASASAHAVAIHEQQPNSLFLPAMDVAAFNGSAGGNEISFGGNGSGGAGARAGARAGAGAGARADVGAGAGAGGGSRVPSVAASKCGHGGQKTKPTEEDMQQIAQILEAAAEAKRKLAAERPNATMFCITPQYTYGGERTLRVLHG